MVHVLTPNVAHCPITVAAFEAGKHVMCEKPMAATTEDAQLMIDAWKKSGKKFTIGYQNRFRKDTQTLFKACAPATWGTSLRQGPRHPPPGSAHLGGVPGQVQAGGRAPHRHRHPRPGHHPVDDGQLRGGERERLGVREAGPHEGGHRGQFFGPWDPDKYEVEDSAFGFIKMKNGATIFLESAWAINLRESREAACTLCGTKAGAEIIGGMSKAEGEYDLIFNKTDYGQLTEETLSPGGTIAFFAGTSDKPEEVECKQWLEAILNDGEPLVKPEQAFTVTRFWTTSTGPPERAGRSNSAEGVRACTATRRKAPSGGCPCTAIPRSLALKRPWRTASRRVRHGGPRH